MNDTTIYTKGDAVPESAEYVCSPCGYRHRFQEGEAFTECTSCMAGSEQDAHVLPAGIWEKVTPGE